MFITCITCLKNEYKQVFDINYNITKNDLQVKIECLFFLKNFFDSDLGHQASLTQKMKWDKIPPYMNLIRQGCREKDLRQSHFTSEEIFKKEG